MYPHGIDPLQFIGPVLSLVLWDIWTEERDGLQVRRIKKKDKKTRRGECEKRWWKPGSKVSTDTWDGGLDGRMKEGVASREGK